MAQSTIKRTTSRLEKRGRANKRAISKTCQKVEKVGRKEGPQIASAEYARESNIAANE